MTERSSELQAQLITELHLALELDKRALGDVWRRTKSGESEEQIATARNTKTSDFVRRELRIVHCIESNEYTEAPKMASMIASAINGLLKNYDFSPEVRKELEDCAARVAPKPRSIADEMSRREALFEQIQSESSVGLVPSSVVSELGVFRGERGVYRNKELTDLVVEGGLAVGLLHTGRSYADDLTEDGVLYHFPSTRNLGTDAADIRSLHNAFTNKTPVFVISTEETLKKVQRGWIEIFDADLKQCYVAFNDSPPTSVIDTNDEVTVPWEARTKRSVKIKASTSVDRDPRFRMLVRRRYRNKCAITGIAVPEMLDAAHIIEVNDNGSDHPENGILLEKGIHAAFDAYLWSIEPGTYKLVTAKGGPSLAQMGITIQILDEITPKPHTNALEIRWEIFKTRQ